ncbi:hypothetical protein V8F06_001658 [Rhypophila decipiens]
MDAIAAITGLLTSAGQVSKGLGPYVAVFEKLLLPIVVPVHSEAQSTKLFLAALQGIIQSGASLSTQRAAIIKVDHLVAILTDGVLIFSELEAAVSSIYPLDENPHYSSHGFPAALHLRVQHIQWTSNQPRFESILSRLEAFRISLSLLVDTLQADTDERAATHVQDLEERVSIILHDNPSLSSYLASDELRVNDGTVRRSAEAGPSRQPQQPRWNLQSTFKNLLFGRSNHRDTSCGILLPASSPFASLSLSEISSPCVVIIPVQPLEIANSEHYEFKFATPASSPDNDCVVPVCGRTKFGFSDIPYFQPDKYIYQDCLVIKAQLQQVPRLKRILDYPWPAPDEESSYSRVLMEMHVLRRLLRSGGLHVITQMIQMVTKVVREGNENGRKSHLCDHEDEFEEWRMNPVPIYLREHDSINKGVNWKQLGKEVSYFTMACLDFPDLRSVMKFKGSTNWLFTLKDIAQDDYKGFVKVMGVIKTVLDRLTSCWMLKHVSPRQRVIRQAEQEGAGELEEQGLPRDSPPAYESGDEDTENGLSEKKALKEK